MPNSIREASFFQTGLESISIGPAIPETASLPEMRAALAPSEETMDHHLQDLLHAPALDSRLLDALRPTLTDRTVLTPASYGALLEEAHGFLGELATRVPPGPDRETLAGAADVLEEEKGLRELLTMYRNVLHKA